MHKKVCRLKWKQAITGMFRFYSLIDQLLWLNRATGLITFNERRVDKKKHLHNEKMSARKRKNERGGGGVNKREWVGGGGVKIKCVNEIHKIRHITHPFHLNPFLFMVL